MEYVLLDPDGTQAAYVLVQHTTYSADASPLAQDRVVCGILAVGYGDGSDILLVLSTQGRGLFDCCAGTKI